MSGHFIYVFDLKSKEMLIANGYPLLKSDEHNHVYVFKNMTGNKFSHSNIFESIQCLYSDTLTF